MDFLITIFMFAADALLLALPLAIGASIGAMFKRERNGFPGSPTPPKQTEREAWLEMVRERKRQRLEMKRELEEELRREGIDTTWRRRDR